MLDFWYTGCTNAIRSLPKMNKLQRRFKDRIQIVMVGLNGQRYQQIEDVYNVLKRKYDLRLASAYDSVLHVKWDIWSMPYIIIVDPSGVVRHITTGSDMSETKLDALLRGEEVKFHRDKDIPDTFQVKNFPGSPDSTLVYRSVLTRWTGERPRVSDLSSYNTWPKSMQDEGIIVVGFRLDQLYKIAYTGSHNPNVFALRDGSLFYPDAVVEVSDRRPFVVDTASFAGRYSVNIALTSPGGKDLEGMMRRFQDELRNAFGYSVKMEEREFDVWRIKADRAALQKLKTSGGARQINITPVNMFMQNVPVETFYRLLLYQLYMPDRIFIDKNENGFEGNVDIDLKAVLTDPADVKKALRKYGIEVIQEKRKLKALVISDPQP